MIINWKNGFLKLKNTIKTIYYKHFFIYFSFSLKWSHKQFDFLKWSHKQFFWGKWSHKQCSPIKWDIKQKGGNIEGKLGDRKTKEYNDYDKTFVELGITPQLFRYL